MSGRYRRRLLVNRFNLAMSLATMAVGMLFLLWILATLFSNGFAALSPTLFTQMTPPPGSAGGFAERNLRQRADRAHGDARQHADRHPGRHLLAE
jgi:phosphate transport system permease protein